MKNGIAPDASERTLFDRPAIGNGPTVKVCKLGDHEGVFCAADGA
jgi:hypothetical protein